MRPTRALELQIEAYRRMTGEQRLALALRLHEWVCNLSRAGIRAQYPEASAQEVERHLHHRIEIGRELRKREGRSGGP